MGQKYYDAVNREPSLAMVDWECETMCYLSWHLYQEEFGKMPARSVRIAASKPRSLPRRGTR